MEKLIAFYRFLLKSSDGAFTHVSFKLAPLLDFQNILKISTVAGFSENPENRHHRCIFRKSWTSSDGAFKRLLQTGTIAGFSKNLENQHHRWIFGKSWKSAPSLDFQKILNIDRWSPAKSLILIVHFLQESPIIRIVNHSTSQEENELFWGKWHALLREMTNSHRPFPTNIIRIVHQSTFQETRASN